MSFELRDYQRTAVDQAKPILTRYNLLYLAAEVRVGKNFMSLTIAKELGWRRVCFITKMSAFSGIKSDYSDFGHQFTVLDIFNFEQSHNIHPIYDGYIIDEAHSIGAFPKPGKHCKEIHKLICAKKSPCILMSGTPTAESYSQIFHQLWVSPFTPFQGYGHRSGEFYGWAKEYVDVKTMMRNGYPVNEYKKANEAKIKEVLKHYMVTVSQEQAGFQSYVQEQVFYVDIEPKLYQLMKVLKKNKVYTLKSGDTIVCDTPARLQQCFHQISSGSIITGEEKNRKYHVLDDSKAQYIKTHFAGKKIAIYYYYISEGNILRKTFPNHTDNPEVFNQSNNLVFIRQMVSGALGVNVSTCDWLIMYNIGFSANIYWQVRARMQTKDRTKPSKLAWIFSRHGLEKMVLKVLTKKKDYNVRYFLKDFNGW